MLTLESTLSIPCTSCCEDLKNGGWIVYTNSDSNSDVIPVNSTLIPVLYSDLLCHLSFTVANICAANCAVVI